MVELISVTKKFKSSARIDESRPDYASFIDDFIPHATVQNTLRNLLSELIGTEQRAYTVTGPYGSGKSTLAIFLRVAFGFDDALSARALGKLDPQLRKQIRDLQAKRDEWVVIPCLCGLQSPMHTITEAIVLGLGGNLEQLESFDESRCLAEIKKALHYAESNGRGVIMLIDEFGKALDFQARSNGDLHFFQSFADVVQDTEMVWSVSFLHQAFSAYAKNRDSRTQDEWSKVQGRFKDFAFNPSVEESVYLISQSFFMEKTLALELRHRFSQNVTLVADEFLKSSDETLFETLPLDPLVAILLGPTFKKSFAQNERSLFSFVATNERYGFRDFIGKESSKHAPFSSLYSPGQMWSYLEENLGHIISSSAESKEWLEASDAVGRSDRMFDDPIYGEVTRTIALMSVMGRTSGIRASREFLSSYFSSYPDNLFSPELICSVLDELQARSIIIFRHSVNSYHVFQASDLDINRLLFEWVERIKDGVDWVNAIPGNRNILANRHYHNHGVMRWATTQVVSHPEQLSRNARRGGDAFLNLVMPVSEHLYSSLKQSVVEDDSLAIAKPSKIEELKVCCIELLAIREAQKDEADTLSRDPIARAELENRAVQASLAVSDRLANCFESGVWEFLGDEIKGRSLSAKVSEIADRVYHLCPCVPNELLNRNKLSGTANSALNKLMLAILRDEGEKELGFPEKTFPPEKGIYISCVKNKGWHTPELSDRYAGHWIPSDETKEVTDHRDSYIIWRAGYDLLTQSKELVTLEALHSFWMAPPYGLTLGLAKLYSMLLLKSLENHLAFYDFDATKDWIYIPELDEELVSKIWRYPHEAAVKHYSLGGVDDALISRVAAAARGTDDLTEMASPLEAARALVRSVHSLPSWVKRSSGVNLFQVRGEVFIPSEVKRFRDVVLAAKDPFKLILEDLPKIFGVDEGIEVAVRTALDTLNDLDAQVTEQFKKTLLELLGATIGLDLERRCNEVVAHSSRPEIENFAKRLQHICSTASEEAFEALIVLVIGVRKESWTDERISAGYDKLRVLCNQFNRYESFISMEKSAAVGTSPVAVIFRSATGKNVQLEQFVQAPDDLSGPLVRVREEVGKQMSSLTKADRTKVLLAELTMCMNEVGSDEA